jgi:hypothetical protein
MLSTLGTWAHHVLCYILDVMEYTAGILIFMVNTYYIITMINYIFCSRGVHAPKYSGEGGGGKKIHHKSDLYCTLGLHAKPLLVEMHVTLKK